MNRHAKFIWIALILGFSFNYFYDKYPDATGLAVFFSVILIAILAVVGIVKKFKKQV